jgi:putative transposase
MFVRRTVFASGEVYHVYNRSLDGLDVFTSERDCKRAVFTLFYYLFQEPKIKLSRFLDLNKENKNDMFEEIKNKPKRVEVVSYCFMPNHFHFLLRQVEDGGLQRFISDFTNSYTRYFNLKHKRVGPLFEGPFKAVHIDTNEQLLHVSRYIHINPAVSFLVEKEKLTDYLWSSLPEYLGEMEFEFCAKDLVLSQFSSRDDYRKFVFAQIDYGRELEKMKHLEK